jgi:drug/metabolite transporter (DMT)-like permease
MTDTAAQPVRYPISGWIEGFLYIFVIAALSLTYVVGHRLGVHPIAFILYAMLVSALVLIAITGPGTEALRIMASPRSWLVGAGTIGMEIFYFLLLEHIAPALGSLLVRLTMPFSLLIGWVLFARRPGRLAFLGAGIVSAVVLALLPFVEAEHRLSVAIAAVGAALAFCLRSFAAEFHPWNRAARTVHEKLRISGLVVLVTSLGSLALAGGGGALVATGHLPPHPMLPTAAQMLHLPTVLLGVLVGGVILIAMAVLGFSCVVKITTENFAAVTSLTPLATLLAQMAGSAVGLIPAYPPDPLLLPAMAAVVFGVGLVLLAARGR